MVGLARNAVTEHERFMQEAQKQLLAFEQRENAFRKQEREERAEELRQRLNLKEMN